jgi:hypothetical protein
MIVFCPNCGTQNAGLPGARASCSACGSTFDVPNDGPKQAPVAEAPKPPPSSFSAPGAQVFTPNPLPAAPRRIGAKTNTLAILSLVAGIICCVPMVSPAVAIGCGIGAMKQINASPSTESGRGVAIAGIILGALTSLLHVLWLIGTLSRGRF